MNNGNEFEIEINAGLLKTIVDAVRVVYPDTKMVIDERGINTAVIGQGHYNMVFMTLEKEMCESFNARKTEIGVDLDKMAKILKLASTDDTVKLTKSRDSSLLNIEFGILKRRLALIDKETLKEPNIPSIDFTTIADVKVSLLDTALRGAEQVDEKMIFAGKPEKLVMHTEQHADDFDATLHKDEHMEYYKTNGKDMAKFSLEFLEDSLKVAKSSDIVTLEFATDKPIKISHKQEDGKLSICYIVAPLVEKDE